VKTEKTAKDFGLHPEFFGSPDRLVALAEYMRYLQLEAIHWYLNTGDRIRSRGLYAMVSDELKIDADVLCDWVSCGEAIRWDRELQAMTPEEREESIAELEREPTPQEIQDLQEWEQVNGIADGPTMEEMVREARQANYEIDVLNQLFGLS
jgi:hypothetical protein